MEFKPPFPPPVTTRSNSADSFTVVPSPSPTPERRPNIPIARVGVDGDDGGGDDGGGRDGGETIIKLLHISTPLQKHRGYWSV
jgi:hypothetical protein